MTRLNQISVFIALKYFSPAFILALLCGRSYLIRSQTRLAGIFHSLFLFFFHDYFCSSYVTDTDGRTCQRLTYHKLADCSTIKTMILKKKSNLAVAVFCYGVEYDRF